MIIQCRRQLIDDEVANITNNKQVSLLYEPPIKSDGGITIDFKEIDVKLCGKSVLAIEKLHIEKGSIVGVTGNGAHLLTSVLYKLLRPSLGVVFIGTQDLGMISQDSLQNIISVVPSDLQVQDITIG
jgi:ABC-type multidrug transport system fused ATPase/permease subunit